MSPKTTPTAARIVGNAAPESRWSRSPAGGGRGCTTSAVLSRIEARPQRSAISQLACRNQHERARISHACAERIERRTVEVLMRYTLRPPEVLVAHVAIDAS